MKTIETWKAAGDGAEGLVIRFATPVPDEIYPVDGEQPYIVAGLKYQMQAETIVAAMAKALPGGLFDAIFVQMCARSASILTVPHDQT